MACLRNSAKTHGDSVQGVMKDQVSLCVRGKVGLDKLSTGRCDFRNETGLVRVTLALLWWVTLPLICSFSLYFTVVYTILYYIYIINTDPQQFPTDLKPLCFCQFFMSHRDFAIICPLLYGCFQDRPALRKWWAWSRLDSRWTHVALRQNRDIIMRDDAELWWSWWNIQYPICVLMFNQSCCCSLEQSGEYSQRYFEIKCHKRENTKEYTESTVESNTYAICKIPHVHKIIIFLQSNSWLSLFHKSPGGIPGDADKWGFMRTI